MTQHDDHGLRRKRMWWRFNKKPRLAAPADRSLLNALCAAALLLNCQISCRLLGHAANMSHKQQEHVHHHAAGGSRLLQDKAHTSKGEVTSMHSASLCMPCISASALHLLTATLDLAACSASCLYGASTPPFSCRHTLLKCQAAQSELTIQAKRYIWPCRLH